MRFGKEENKLLFRARHTEYKEFSRIWEMQEYNRGMLNTEQII
jgi:hypothetical protein